MSNVIDIMTRSVVPAPVEPYHCHVDYELEFFKVDKTGLVRLYVEFDDWDEYQRFVTLPRKDAGLDEWPDGLDRCNKLIVHLRGRVHQWVAHEIGDRDAIVHFTSPGSMMCSPKTPRRVRAKPHGTDAVLLEIYAKQDSDSGQGGGGDRDGVHDDRGGRPEETRGGQRRRSNLLGLRGLGARLLHWVRRLRSPRV